MPVLFQQLDCISHTSWNNPTHHCGLNSGLFECLSDYKLPDQAVERLNKMCELDLENDGKGEY